VAHGGFGWAGAVIGYLAAVTDGPTPGMIDRRGRSTTRLLSSETFRNVQQSALAVDVIALMDAAPNR
jgi:hypothetical protein